MKEKLKVMVADPYNAPVDDNNWFVGERTNDIKMTLQNILSACNKAFI